MIIPVIRIEYCVVPEKIHTHPMEGYWKFLLGGGGGGALTVDAKFLKAMWETKLEFPGVRGMQNENPSVGGVWIFSGTAQYVLL